ncbi:MAG: aspartate aminotransferase family protein [Gemmatimonadetes bacterium]|nr:aspartate aminotransferase family protein [Gemmatimonadota bacterium]
MNPTLATRSAADILDAHRTWLFPCVTPYYDQPIVMSEAEGVHVTDADGREYLDLFSGILSTSIGHCHPRLVEAVQQQAARLGHTSTLYVSEPQVEAARRLAGIAPGQLDRTFFTNSGTEAIETALALACIYTGRSEIIALRMSYHGRSSLAANVTAHASWRPLASQVAGIHHAIAPDTYRLHVPITDEDALAEYFARDLDEVIRTTTNGRPAAFIAETIQGVAGYTVPPKGYFERVRDIVHGYGGLLIIDEVQAGFGRTGDHWFGIEHYGVEPDIMVMAKGIAGGYPAAATVTREEIASAWQGKTISTFGGNPVSMAAAVATLDVMREEDVPTRAAERGAQLRSALEALADRYAWIGDVRGMGLMQALDLVKDRGSRTADSARARALLEAAKEEGLLIGLGGHWGQVIRIGPSLLVTEEELADGIQRLERACARVDG